MMNRRHFLSLLGLASAAGTSYLLFKLKDGRTPIAATATLPPVDDSKIKDNLYRNSHFDETFVEDIYLPENEHPLLKATVSRLHRVQALVGHGNFCMLSLDEMLSYAKNYSQIEAFTKPEIEFLERVFFQDAREYGFMGEKLITTMSEVVNKEAGVKIPGTGNYLFKGRPLATYTKLKKDIGDQLVLTSGIRSIVKQMHLFLTKVQESNGNLSMASRSLAPPGHSYHAIGDFDVGNITMGELNFTEQFAQTEEFAKLVKLGYVSIRYTQENHFGVRYEPWHIKVV